jgi:hypothetical protein
VPEAPLDTRNILRSVFEMAANGFASMVTELMVAIDSPHGVFHFVRSAPIGLLSQGNFWPLEDSCNWSMGEAAAGEEEIGQAGPGRR